MPFLPTARATVTWKCVNQCARVIRSFTHSNHSLASTAHKLAYSSISSLLWKKECHVLISYICTLSRLSASIGPNRFSFYVYHRAILPKRNRWSVHSIVPIVTNTFFIRTLFFGEALMFLFFSRFKPKNDLRGFLTIFVHIYNKDYRNTKI